MGGGTGSVLVRLLVGLREEGKGSGIVYSVPDGEDCGEDHL